MKNENGACALTYKCLVNSINKRCFGQLEQFFNVFCVRAPDNGAQVR